MAMFYVCWRQGEIMSGLFDAQCHSAQETAVILRNCGAAKSAGPSFSHLGRSP